MSDSFIWAKSNLVGKADSSRYFEIEYIVQLQKLVEGLVDSENDQKAGTKSEY